MPESFSTDSLAVQLPDIESQLSALWGESAKQGTGGSPSARTVVLTLLAICQEKDSAGEVSRSAAAVAADHPSRAIIVTSQPGEPGISAAVSVSCQLLGHVERQLCSEQIHIEASGIDIERISSFVQPLALPDVPLVLWLADAGPPADPALDRLAQVSDRVLLDSRTAGDMAASFDWITRVPQPGGPPVVDLAWVALEPYRLAFAQLFEPEASRRYLPRIDDVTVRSERPESGARMHAEALLIAGWAVSRLAWQGFSLVRDAEDGIHLTARGGRRIHLMYGGGSPVSSLALAAGSEALFETKFDEEGQAALLVSNLGDQPGRAEARLTARTPDQVLCGALEIDQLDPLFAEAVSAASAILAQAEPPMLG